MMPKEKAVELYNFYIEFNVGHIFYKSNTKKCAIKVVDEIIKEYGTYYKMPIEGKYVSYWEEVKKEIENL